MGAECWVAVPEYKGLYAVSDRGRVMSFHVRRGSLREDRILRAGLFKDYYPTVTLSKNGKPKMFHVFKLVALAFLGPVPDGCEVNHKDGIKTNSNADNLEYVTPSENAKHAFRLGLRKPTAGINHHNAKLTNEKVIQMRQRHADGATIATLARDYGLSTTHTGAILLRRFWKHI